MQNIINKSLHSLRNQILTFLNLFALKGIALCALLVTARVGCATTGVGLSKRGTASSVGRRWQGTGGSLEILATSVPPNMLRQYGEKTRRTPSQSTLRSTTRAGREILGPSSLLWRRCTASPSPGCARRAYASTTTSVRSR